MKRKTEALLVTSKKTGLEVNAEKTKYMVMSRDHNAGQNHYISKGNKSFEGVEQFRYLGTTLTTQNCVHEKIKSALNSGNACVIRHRIVFQFIIQKYKDQYIENCNCARCFVWM
jgi:hypothetical protein